VSFLAEADFKQRPVRAVLRRIQWRLHWRLRPHRLLQVRNWWDHVDISLPRSGSAAYVYYTQRVPIAKERILRELLREGMVAIDVGAHIGAYTLVISRLVGESGSVHAFEPQADLAALISENVLRNKIRNCQVLPVALGNNDGEAGFVTDDRSKGGWMAQDGAGRVPCATIDSYIRNHRLSRVDFIKLDAAGNELAVLQGGAECLRNMHPSIYCSLYHPKVTLERHGYQLTEILDLLHQCGYQMYLYDESAAGEKFPIRSHNDLLSRFGETGPYGYPLVATRRV
jgi:FkbM family methyltransferase